MKAFEIYVNGEKVRTIGVECGTIHVGAAWAIGGYRGYRPEPHTHMSGADGVAQESIRWGGELLREGDEVTIRVVADATPDPYKEKLWTDRIVPWSQFTGGPIPGYRGAE